MKFSCLQLLNGGKDIVILRHLNFVLLIFSITLIVMMGINLQIHGLNWTSLFLVAEEIISWTLLLMLVYNNPLRNARRRNVSFKYVFISISFFQKGFICQYLFRISHTNTQIFIRSDHIKPTFLGKHISLMIYFADGVAVDVACKPHHIK